MADKGFIIQDLLTPLNCGVVMPSFLSSKKSFSKRDLQESKNIHNVRVHVERAIRRVKEFHYFDKAIPLTVAGIINRMWTVACLITNFQGRLFYEYFFFHLLHCICSKTLLQFKTFFSHLNQLS